jgi:glycosyltransferase involved in cell wall biosynthesis
MTIHSSLAPELIVQRQALVRRASAHYRAIVCTSDVIRDAMIAAGIGPERLWVAPAFIADALEERMTPAGLQAVRRRHAIVFATWVDSTYEPGLPVLLEAFAKLRSTHPEAALIVAGQAVWRPEYARPNVYLLGRLARAESLGLVATCDVFVWPPLLGGDDIRIREALALGRRVVATDAARRPPGVQLCRAGDAADLARVMAEATFAAAPRAPALQARETLLAVYRQLGLDDGEDACATSLEA